MIINATYYKSGSLHIPESDMTSRTRNENETPIDRLNIFINAMERELIINALNPTLWSAIDDSYDSEGVLNPSAPDWVKDLINGTTYEIDGVSKVWDGLSNSYSCLVYYVFCKWFFDNQYSNQQGGLSQITNSGSVRVDPSDFYQNQWNTFIGKYQNDCNSNEYPVYRTYQSGILIDYYNQDKENPIVTLLQFIDDYESLNPDTYTDANKQMYERLNSFGL